MGRKGSWFSSVKKIFISDSNKDTQKHHHHHRSNSKLQCFGHHENFDDANEWTSGAPKQIKVVGAPSLPPRKDVVKPTNTEAEDEQSKQAFSLILATAVATGATVAAAKATRDTRVTSIPRWYIGKTNEEIAAIKIQTMFRAYIARRTLRGLRGLARLKALVKGHSVQRQAATTLQCMQTLSRLQSQVSARKIRMTEENQSFQRQLQQKREKELDKLQSSPFGEKWDDSSKSKDQIQARLLNRQIAAMRREKALAYASTHQQTWRNSSKAGNATIMDPNNPHWGWNWLDRWMASRPWEGQNTKEQKNHKSAKSAVSQTMSVGEISKLYTLRDQNQQQNNTNSPTSQKTNHQNPHLRSAIPTTPKKTKPNTSSSRGGSWGGDSDSKIIFNHQNSKINRRHSIAISPLKEDENSFVNSPAKVTKMKSKFQSGSVKKQSSFTDSPTSSRRLSVPGKMVLNSNKSVEVKNGGNK